MKCSFLLSGTCAKVVVNLFIIHAGFKNLNETLKSTPLFDGSMNFESAVYSRNYVTVSVVIARQNSFEEILVSEKLHGAKYCEYASCVFVLIILVFE